MLEKVTQSWWKFALRGIIAIIFGILALNKPDQALRVLVLTFGAYALMDGFLAVIAGISLAPFFNRWWALLLEGMAGIIMGLLTFFWPNITALALVYYIAAWAVITGIFEIVAAIQLRHVITGEWMLILGGLLSILFGVLLFVFPGVGAASLTWLVSIYAVAFGITEVILAFRMHSMWREVKKEGERSQSAAFL